MGRVFLFKILAVLVALFSASAGSGCGESSSPDEPVLDEPPAASTCDESCTDFCETVWTTCRIAAGRSEDLEEIPYCIATCSLNVEAIPGHGLRCARCLAGAGCDDPLAVCELECENWSMEAGNFDAPRNYCGVTASVECEELCSLVSECTTPEASGPRSCVAICLQAESIPTCSACVRTATCEVALPSGSLGYWGPACEADCE